MNLKYRKDGRTDKQFAKDIKNRTKKEKFLVQLFKRECEHLGYDCTISDNGVDNDGDIVKVGTCAADYRIVIVTPDHTYDNLYEVKNSPVAHKWTFKTHNLKQYVKQGANILLFWGTGGIDKDPFKIDYINTRWGVIKPENIAEMLETYSHYEEFMFGRKMCIQVPKVDFGKWLTIRKLSARC